MLIKTAVERIMMYYLIITVDRDGIKYQLLTLMLTKLCIPGIYPHFTFINRFLKGGLLTVKPAYQQRAVNNGKIHNSNHTTKAIKKEIKNNHYNFAYPIVLWILQPQFLKFHICF